MDHFWWFALPVAAGTFYGCYFWNQRHAQPDWLRLPTRADYLLQHPECATDDEHGARCCACGSDKCWATPRPAGLIIAFATPASPAARRSFAPKSPRYKHPHSPSLYGDVWRWQMLTPAKQQRARARDRETSQMEKDLTALKRKWLKKHLQALRAVKDEEQEKGTMLAFVGILCALLPILTAAVYFVGMRYYHGYLGQFGLKNDEFSLSPDTTLFHGFYLLIQLFLPYVLPLVTAVAGLFLSLTFLFFKVKWRLRLSWWLFRFVERLPIVQEGGKIAHHYPAPFTFHCLSWLKRTYFKFTVFILPPLLVIMASEHIKPMGEELAKDQITLLEQSNWPESKAHSQSPLLGDEPHIRIGCNTSHCAYRLKGGDTLILRLDQITETRYQPDKAAPK